jgi:hypothetical protein
MYMHYEALAKERMREQRVKAAQRRLANEVASARRWRRLASYTARRATKSQTRLSNRSAALRLSG